ncbi:MAG: glycosyltransferase family 39 protein [Phycisphaerales bacterium]
MVLCLAVYLPGIRSIPPVDRDESRFAQASRQMFESLALPPQARIEHFHDGWLAIPKIQDRPRLNKPPLIYWLQTASAAVFSAGDPTRDAIWMYRLPSALCAIVAALCTWRLGAAMFDQPTGLLAGALLAVCPMVVWDAHQARADQLLLACTTSAMAALWKIRSRPGALPHIARLNAAWLWVSIALGILAKGPITPMIVALTALGLSWTARDWRWLARTRPVAGIVVLVVLIVPWLILVASHVGVAEASRIFVRETLGRSTGAMEGHWGPPGYHTVLSAVLFWPGSLLTLTAFCRTWRLAVRLPGLDPESTRRSRLRSLPARWRQRVLGRDRELFLVAWIVPAWIVFELIMTKLPHYTMPMYPALALISAQAVVDAARARIDSSSAERMTAGLTIWFIIGVAICCIAPLGLALLGGGAAAVAAAAIVAACSFWMLFQARREALEGLMLRAQLWSIAAALIFVIATLGFLLPRAQLLWVSTRAAAALAPDRPVACAGNCEDSIIFMTRGRIRHVAEDDALSWLRAHLDGMLILPRTQSTAELDLRRIDTFAGYNYANGRWVTLDVVELAR